MSSLKNIVWETWLDTGALAALLHAPGSSVTQLELNTNWQCGWHPVIANHPATLHLRDCSTLQSITLRWEVGRMCCADDSFQRERNHRISIATLTLLASLPETIRKITIHFHLQRSSTLSYFENHASVHWHSLGEILQRYQELETVTFGVPDYEDGRRSGCQEVIETCLKTLYARDILRFTSSSSEPREKHDHFPPSVPDLETFLW